MTKSVEPQAHQTQQNLLESARSTKDELNRRLEQLHLLLEVNNGVISHLDLRELFPAISKYLRRVINHDAAGITLYDSESNQLRILVLESRLTGETAVVEGRMMPLENTPGGVVFETRQTKIFNLAELVQSESPLVKQVIADGVKSGCIAPLIVHGRVLGTLDVASLRDNAFSSRDAELLEQIAGQVAIAVENALNYERALTAQQQLARERDRSQLLLQINNAVVSHLDLKELLKTISVCLRQEFHHDFAGLLLYDAQRNQLLAHALDFADRELMDGVVFPIEGTPSGLAFTSRQPVVVTPRELETFAQTPLVQILRAEGVQSGCSLPLLSHGRALGVLTLMSLSADTFTGQNTEVLQEVASQIAIAVENALNYQRAREAEHELARKLNHLRLMLKITNAVVSQLGLRELVRVTAACLREALHTEIAGVSLYDPESNQLRAYAYDIPDKQFAVEEGTPVPLEGSLGGMAFTSGQPVFVNRPGLLEVKSELNKRFSEIGVKSGGCVPLIVQGRKLGVLGVASLREDAFPEDHQQLLGQIANQIAIAVENALNFERARTAERRYLDERDRLQLLLDVNNAIASALTLPELFRAVSGSLRQVFEHDFAVMGLYDEEKGELRAYALDGASGFDFLEEGMLVPLDGTPAGRSVLTKQPVIIRPGDAQKFSSEIVKRSVEQGLRSSCSAPLLRRTRVVGAMTIASKSDGAFDAADGELLMQIAGQIAIAVENALAYREIDTLKNKLASEKLYLEDEIRIEHNFEELIGASRAFTSILKQIENVAPTDAAVLIRGETGTGKELIARAIHSLSDRRERTLVKLNCAAIPTGLLESELFGHEKGAFTGAIAQRVGRFELANKGTLFLDEVGDIPLELQPKLLRVLQEQEFERLGSTRTQKVDVRMIAATNCDLEQMVAEKKYRSDLYYRLNVVPIKIPPLRERTEDIPTLARFFTQKYARRLKKRIETIPAESMAALSRYHWPGNVRELEHFIERAVVLTQGADLEVPLGELKHSAPAQAANIATLEDAEREHILHALEETNWVIGGPDGAAARLGMKRTTLQSKMQRLGISRQR